MAERMTSSILTRPDSSASSKSNITTQPFPKLSNVLPEKLLFYKHLEQEVLTARQAGKALAVLCLNLNGREGPDTSGDALTHAERRVSDMLRTSGTITRTGRDEYLILVQNPKDINALENLANKILAVFAQSFEAVGTEFRVSFSGIGCAVYPVDGAGAEALIGNAAAAAFRSKKNSGRKIVFFSDATNGDIHDELKMTSDMYHALERNEFELYYQPQVDSRLGKIVGMEAVLRWNHPENGMISPVKFIPVAEKTGLIMEIGEWVVKTACRQNKYWQDMGLLKVPVAVNLSGRQFEDEHMAETIEGVLKETGLPAKYLELEITESIALREPDNVLETLNRLKKLGIEIAVDDFGTAYSSLNYIKQLPVDTVKIDKCFIDGIGVGGKDEAVLKTVIALIRDLGLKAVAEGVETKRQVVFLAREECWIIQGFYFYEPMPTEDIERLLKFSRQMLGLADTGCGRNPTWRLSVTRYLDTLGIKHSNMGFQYLETAIQLGIENPSLLVKVTDLYERISEIYKKKPCNIERSIRYSIQNTGKDIANKEFITRTVDDILYSGELKCRHIANKGEYLSFKDKSG